MILLRPFLAETVFSAHPLHILRALFLCFGPAVVLRACRGRTPGVPGRAVPAQVAVQRPLGC
eukprot:7332113-Pyramimonas_sp.AAC.1